MLISKLFQFIIKTQQESKLWTTVGWGDERGIIMVNNDNDLTCTVLLDDSGETVSVVTQLAGQKTLRNKAVVDDGFAVNRVIFAQAREIDPNYDYGEISSAEKWMITDFLHDYGTAQLDYIIMGETLITTLLDGIGVENLVRREYQFARGDFSGSLMLSNLCSTVAFFMKMRPEIKAWLKRDAKHLGLRYAVDSNNPILAPLFEAGYSLKDLKAIIVTGDTTNPHYILVADLMTKALALRLTNNFTAFTNNWLPF